MDKLKQKIRPMDGALKGEPTPASTASTSTRPTSSIPLSSTPAALYRSAGYDFRTHASGIFHDARATTPIALGGSRATDAGSSRAEVPSRRRCSTMSCRCKQPRTRTKWSGNRFPSGGYAPILSSDAREFRLPAKQLKAGVKQMVSQEWARHRREQKLVSAKAHELNQVMFLQESAAYQSECFMGEMRLLGEIYSDTEPIARGHSVLDTLTLGTGWGFTNYRHQTLALALIKRRRPHFLMLAFPCTHFSPLQRLAPQPTGPSKQQQKYLAWMRACRARFAVKVAFLQLDLGAHFALENPRGSSAWRLSFMATTSQSWCPFCGF